MPEYEEVSLIKGGHLYIIRFRPLEENRAFEELLRLVDDPDHNFDGLDAKVMLEKINERAKNRENANE
ncbi:hypothetical protein HYV88_01585 [Candidatus Woesearchaeota archaeon]|nr:hypothetical protein [Candidatus Woesearchaeota archaeon]